MQFVVKRKIKYFGGICVVSLILIVAGLSFLYYYDYASTKYQDRLAALNETRKASLALEYQYKLYHQSMSEWALSTEEKPAATEQNHQEISEIAIVHESILNLQDLLDESHLAHALLTQLLQSSTPKNNSNTPLPLNLLQNISTIIEHENERATNNAKQRLNLVRHGLSMFFVALLAIGCLILVRLTSKLLLANISDKTTGLGNRELFVESLSDLQCVKHSSFACLLDIDNFKVINETCGSAGADNYLREIGKIIKQKLGNKAVICRISGDTIGIIIKHMDRAAASSAIEQIQHEISHYHYQWRSVNICLTCSIGGYWIMPDTPDSFLENVLNSLYACLQEAKEAGKNRLVIFDDQNNGLSWRQQQLRMVGVVEASLNDKRVVLFKQAITPIQDVCDIYYEVLLRVIDENGDIQGPGLFLETAARFQLIAQVDRYILEHTVRYLAQNQEDKAHYSINLSGQSLSDESLPVFAESLFAQYQFNPAQLGFEITETDIIKNINVARQTIAYFKSKGCKISLDDFGTGMSSYAYIAELGIDAIKIDGAFVQKIHEKPQNQAILRSIVSLARDLGLDTVAEYVEQQEELSTLAKLNVAFVQGFLLHKPAMMYQPITT